jgi:hemolysin activation/secretion protein
MQTVDGRMTESAIGPSTAVALARTMKGRLATVVVALLAVAPFPANGQTAVPGAGTMLQDIRPLQPPAPSTTQPGLTLPEAPQANLPPTVPFAVKAITISGNTAFNTATLHALIAGAEGKELTLSELSDFVSRITDYYHAHGYPLARAIIPAQTIRGGAVAIEIIEARYGKIILDNHSRVSDLLLQSTLSPLKSGQLIEQGTLDHALLLLSDIPGVAQSATLKPGEATGTSDLFVQGALEPAAAGVVTVDNDGNRYTGQVRAGGEVALYDPLHHGDVLDANVLSSGRDLDYGRLSYDFLLDGSGTHLGGSYSALHYDLAGSLAPLEGHGTAGVETLWVKHPLVRTSDLNLYGLLQFDSKQLRDAIDVSATHTDRHLDNWTASLTGDWRDSLLSGGTTSWSAQWVQGRLGFDNATAQADDAATARTRGPFSQLNATLARLQRLGTVGALYVALSGQWANGNLDPSQKMVAGGRYTVRAYDMSAVSGDTGVQGTTELRRDLKHTWHGQWQALIFLDAQHVTVNKDPWTAGKNDATLRGTGVGVGWTNTHQWNAKAYVAARLGAAPELAGRTSLIHAWFEVSKGF